MARARGSKTPSSAIRRQSRNADAAARARESVDAWLGERELSGRPGQQWLRAMADELLAGYSALSERWLQLERRDIRAARAALLAVEEDAAARAADATGKHFHRYELAAARSSRERDEVWQALLPDGVELRELWQLMNRAARAAHLPTRRPRH